MLPSAHRLTRRRDFARVSAAGKSVYTPSLRLRWVVTGRPASRFAVVVSSRVSKHATKRNRLKRQLRTVLRQQLKQVKPGFDTVLSAAPQALGQPYAALRDEIQTLVRKSPLRQ
jgi:ribonuclease P protein component